MLKNSDDEEELSFEEALNNLRVTFDDYIKNKVLKLANIDHLGYAYSVYLFVTSVQKYSILVFQPEAFPTSKDLPVIYLKVIC